MREVRRAGECVDINRECTLRAVPTARRPPDPRVHCSARPQRACARIVCKSRTSSRRDLCNVTPENVMSFNCIIALHQKLGMFQRLNKTIGNLFQPITVVWDMEPKIAITTNTM